MDDNVIDKNFKQPLNSKLNYYLLLPAPKLRFPLLVLERSAETLVRSVVGVGLLLEPEGCGMNLQGLPSQGDPANQSKNAELDYLHEYYYRGSHYSCN